MRQRDLNRALARATGESVSTIARMGFSLAMQPADHDPEPCDDRDIEAKILDWDQLEADQRLPWTYGRAA